MNTGELWHWSSLVWLWVAGWLSGYLLMVRGSHNANRIALFTGAILLALAFVSPIGVLADGYLFSAHMVQHLILLLVVPACILLSLPAQQAESWQNRPGWQRISQLLSTPALGWVCGVGAMWFWHIPTLCSSATLSPVMGLARDASLVAAGVAFWWPIYGPSPRHRLHPLSGCIYLFSACLGCTLLGIYITFAPLSVCPVFANPVDRIGILNSLYDVGFTPGIDQRIGGLMMWVPPCLLYTCAIISLLSRWYSTLEPSPVVNIHAEPKEA